MFFHCFPGAKGGNPADWGRLAGLGNGKNPLVGRVAFGEWDEGSQRLYDSQSHLIAHCRHRLGVSSSSNWRVLPWLAAFFLSPG